MKDKLNILIVDDERLSRYKLEGLLNAQGYLNIKTAEDGQAGLIHFEKPKKPELVFLDIIMPNLDGPGFVRQLLKLGHSPYIIMVSATAILENKDEAANFGAMDFVAKPFNAHKINEAMQHFHRVLERSLTNEDSPVSFRY